MKASTDEFNKLTITLLSKLYDTFPVEQDVMLSEHDHLDTAENSEIFFSTLKFLNDEGYVSYSTQIYGGFLAVRLTSKGLALLNSTPSSISKTESLISVFKDAVKDGTSQSYKTCIKELTSLSLSSIVKKIADE